HTAGRRSRREVEESRERIAAAVGARPSEVVLTTGGTESDNLAVKGLFWARRDADPRRRRVLVSALEHHAVLESAEWLHEHEGAEVELLPVDSYGRVHPDVLRAALLRAPDDVALVSVMWANNEVGTVNPIRELAATAHEFGVPLHTDAVQAVGILDVDFTASGVDALILTGHKLGGPYGAGALLLGREVALTPLLHGGGQERDVRSGTLDHPGIVGLATAVELAVADAPRRARVVAGLRDDLVGKVRATVPDATLNGDPGTGVVDGGPSRLPGNAHLSFPGCEGDSLLMLLDAQGIECSTGSACTAGVARPSHVLLAMGADEATARGSLRFSLGHTSTGADVEAVAAVIGQVVERARRAGQPASVGW
ncbi:MAG: cysteine desulfurase family protein, partial [Actinomycetes bacterium]